MIQIKTIAQDLSRSEKFDKEVNEAIADGWTLAKRERVSTPSGCEDYLYAELVKEIITEAERNCDNCRHFDNDADAEPCASCSSTASNWEAAE